MMLKLIGAGLILAALATAPLFRYPLAISNHGDINRALIYQGVAREAVLAGRLPLWEPYLCGGQPLLANLESWFLQPFFLLTLPFTEPVALKISYALTLATAFIGFAMLGRLVLKLSWIATFVFGVITVFSGYLSQHLAEGFFTWIGTAWVPWCVLAACLSLKRPWLIPVAGLAPAFIFGSGSMPLVFYTVLFLGVVFGIAGFREKSWRPLLTLLAIVAFAALLAAPKLMPAVTLLFTHENRPGIVPSLTLLPAMLLDRSLARPVIFNGINYRWSEFGNYVGLISIGLAGLGLARMIIGPKRYRPGRLVQAFLWASAGMLVLVFLPLPASAPGPLQAVIELLRMPVRVMIFPIMGFSILAGLGIDVLARAVERRSLSVLVLIGVLALLVLDLVSYDQTLFRRTFRLPLPDIPREETFRRAESSFTTPVSSEGESLYYRAGYVDYLANRGTNDLCRYYQRSPTTVGHNTVRRDQAYRGEVYLAEPGAVRIETMQPGLIRVSAQTTVDNLLVINQSYDAGWRANGKPAVDIDGLLAAPAPAGTTLIELIYSPPIITWAFLISGIGVLLALWWIRVWR